MRNFNLTARAVRESTARELIRAACNANRDFARLAVTVRDAATVEFKSISRTEWAVTLYGPYQNQIATAIVAASDAG